MKYVIIKPRAGGTAFWRSMIHCLREGEHRVLRLKLHSRAYLYLFPIESVDLEQIITRNYVVADVEKISWDGREEIIIEKKKIKYIDEWGFENESWIIKVRTRNNKYTVYPNRRIKQLTGQNQSLSNVPGVQSQTLRFSRTTESNSDIGPDTVSDSEPGPGSAESETEHLDRW